MGKATQNKRLRRLARVQAALKNLPEGGYLAHNNGPAHLTSAVVNIKSERGTYRWLKKRKRK
jgi:hypothetical protein